MPEINMLLLQSAPFFLKCITLGHILYYCLLPSNLHFMSVYLQISSLCRSIAVVFVLVHYIIYPAFYFLRTSFFPKQHLDVLEKIFSI